MPRGVRIPRPCSMDGCSKLVNARGLCSMHYRRYRLHGDPTVCMTNINLSETERFWLKVNKTDACWLWTGAVGGNGYGNFGIRSWTTQAHRYSYELLVGPIPNDMILDHTCFRPLCVNPGHLRLATRKQNGENLGRLQSNNTSGHRGVAWNKKHQSWVAQVGHEGKNFFIGYFASVEEAAEAARRKRNELFTHNILDRRGDA